MTPLRTHQRPQATGPFRKDASCRTNLSVAEGSRIGRMHPVTFSSRQDGVALVVALLLLVVITLVGFAAVRGTIVQQKLASNMYDREVAFQSAEAALREGEIAVQAAASASAFYDCSPTSGNKCLPNGLDDPNVPASSVVTVSTGSYDAGAIAAAQPEYVVEYLGNFTVPKSKVTQMSNCSGYAPCGQLSKADFFKITARSGPADVQDRASVTLQSIYRK
jgi:type IV pilus assembly protein PilX